MAADSIIDVLDLCLAEIQAGRATIDECLAQYPEFRDELESLLSIASGIAAFSAVPDPQHKTASRARFVAALEAASFMGQPSASGLSERPQVPVPSLASVASVPDVLDACVDEILAGRATADECLTRYPELQGELEPLLAVVSRLTRLDSAPDPARKLAARARFIEALYAEREHRGVRGLIAAFLGQAASFRRGFRGAVSLGLALAVVTGSGAVYAAEQALPGAPLYGVKLAVEQVRIVTAFDEESKVQVELDIASRRVAEVERSLELRDERAVQTAAAGYAATIEQADDRFERIAAGANRVSTERLETNLDRHQRALATAVAQAPPSAKGVLEQARGRAERAVERSRAAGNRDSGRQTGGPAAAAPVTTRGSAQSLSTNPPSPTATATHTATVVPTSSPVPTTQREVTPEPTGSRRREEVPPTAIRQGTPVPTVVGRGAPTASVPSQVPAPGRPTGPNRGRDREAADEDGETNDGDRGRGQDDNRGGRQTSPRTPGPAIPRTPPVRTIQPRGPATVPPVPPVAVPTRASPPTLSRT